MIERILQLYRYYGLAQVLIAKELKVRYRGTSLGFLWSFINPLLLMLIYVLVFSVYMRVQMEHFSAYLLCGILPWAWFSSALTEGSSSILVNGGLIKKVSLPAEIFPLVTTASTMIHYLLSLPILLIFLACFGIKFSWILLLLPFIMAVQFVFAFSLTLITSSLVVQFRDLIHIVPNLLMIWMFATPVVYPESMIPAKYQFLLNYNPMAWFIGAYHDIFFYDRMPSLTGLALLTLFTLVFFVLALMFFDSRKDVFAEEV